MNYQFDNVRYRNLRHLQELHNIIYRLLEVMLLERKILRHRGIWCLIAEIK